MSSEGQGDTASAHMRSAKALLFAEMAQPRDQYVASLGTGGYKTATGWYELITVETVSGSVHPTHDFFLAIFSTYVRYRAAC
jgi:hypothetical protein